MVKITKIVLPKHEDSLSPFVKDFVSSAASVPLSQLPKKLEGFPSRWPFQRGDLYHWIPLLNRFDDTLESFCTTYKLVDGPQTRDFGCELLGQDESFKDCDFTFPEDGDRVLVESILGFSRLLLENCGNRSIYASSPYLSMLLNSTSLSLIAATLQIGKELAERYQASYKRMANPHRHANAALLANHYNIDLDRVLQLSLPPVRTTVSSESHIPATPATPATPSAKGKDKAYFSLPVSNNKTTISTQYANDLVSLAKGHDSSDGSHGTADHQEIWADWGEVRLTFYETLTVSTEMTEKVPQPTTSLPQAPSTPTPVRRTSSLGQQSTPRQNRHSGSDDISSVVSRSPTIPAEENHTSSSLKVLEIPSSRIASLSIHELLKEYLPQVPDDVKYELLSKLRNATAFAHSAEARQQVLGVRILAITNLCYIHLEHVFFEKVLKHDIDAPRRLQIIYQLAELIHPPSEGQRGVPKGLQTIALAGLQAIGQYATKHADLAHALNTSVNHGVLLYVTRKAVAEMAEEDTGDKITDDDMWRSAVFSLLECVTKFHNVGTSLVNAGLVQILVEVLTLRTETAQRNFKNVVQFIDQIVFILKEAFGVLVSCDGLDAISALIVDQGVAALELLAADQGMPDSYRARNIDYQLPFRQQATLASTLKFVHHMMTQVGGGGGTFDRLLRNLIDSSKFLGTLRVIMENVDKFGSSIWTNAVNILNDFINNEPTSFAVIDEAGLSRAFLEAVSGEKIILPDDTQAEAIDGETMATAESSVGSPETGNQSIVFVHDDMPHPPTRETLASTRDRPLAQGIVATAEALNTIPQTFGAICLNSSGMRMFRASNALSSFFEIFESPEHVRIMEMDANLPLNLGATFDELIRHHPTLKDAVINASVDMVARVAYLCNSEALTEKDAPHFHLSNSDSQENCATFATLSQSSGDSLDKGMGKAGPDVVMGGTQRPPIIHDTSTKPPTSKVQSAAYISAVSCYLTTVISNSTLRNGFVEKGGIEMVLDLCQASSLSYTVPEEKSRESLHKVIAQLAEQKPHMVMPSLLKRTQAAADALIGFVKHGRTDAYFKRYVTQDGNTIPRDREDIMKDTVVLRGFVGLQSLLTAVRQCFAPPTYNHRSSGTVISQVNLADYWMKLVATLGPILGASVAEDFNLRHLVPHRYKRSAAPREHYGYAKDVALELETYDVSGEQSSAPNEKDDITHDSSSLPKADQESTQYRNYTMLRVILAKFAPTIAPLFQILGKTLLSKRNIDNYARQAHAAIADTLADTVLRELVFCGDEPTLSNYNTWIIMVEATKELLVNMSRHTERPYECITVVLQVFKKRQGFSTLNNILKIFTEKCRNYNAADPKDVLMYNLATAGARNILSLYLMIVNGKCLMESAQTIVMSTRGDKDPTKPDYFSAGQLLVELRMVVLPAIRELWQSDIVEKGLGQICNKLIDIIRTISNADYETSVLKKTDKVMIGTKVARKVYSINNDLLSQLEPYGIELAREALYRCVNNQAYAAEYCKAHKTPEEDIAGGRNPVPAGEVNVTPAANPATQARNSVSTGTSTPEAMMILDEVTSGPLPIDAAILRDLRDNTATEMHLDDSIGNQSSPSDPINPAFGPAVTTAPVNQESEITSADAATESPFVTLEDLNIERQAIRDNLIDRCLDVINAHGEVTFEVSDLLTVVVNKSPDPTTMRKEMGDTLVNALMSFTMEDDVRPIGKKVAAYAHLLALMLQDKPFYSACLHDLKASLDNLLGFVKLPPTHHPEEPSPWIAHVLLILETLLSDDSQPRESKWTFPKTETDVIEAPIFVTGEPVVKLEQKNTLLNSLLDIMPRVGKDESLALSVLRILVILTRTRSIAQAMGEKKNMQRLFVMAKQLAGNASVRLQNPLMIVLRHIVEDADTIKQIMRADVRNIFETASRTRGTDVKTYLTSSAHLVIRAPELFVEVSNEMLRLGKWSPVIHEQPLRQSIFLKEEFLPSSNRHDSSAMILPAVQATEELSIEDIKPSTENIASEVDDKPKLAELKAPVVETPGGVIHFLLSELLSYRDVEDRDPAAPSNEKTDKAVGVSFVDTIVADVPSSSSNAESSPQMDTESKELKKPTKPEFKADEHPIYIYRCFLLQCLTELLHSYNRTKIEFINFKRHSTMQMMTPSKPRSSVVNYLLTDLIPHGTLEHSDSIAARKKLTTSSWADSVLTALLSKTGEQIVDRGHDPMDLDDEPDLLFVRKFVLENVLKAYKEASISSEPLDVKYARILSLADLMSHIMTGKDPHAGATGDQTVQKTSSVQLKRIMYEKGYVTALTGSIADIDLNFPGAKRAVKYILRPLKNLTQTAINLSYQGKITAPPGEGDEDDIVSATSVSDMDDERETPDLFRNSALGMFEPHRDHESESDSEDEDEEMYDGYDDEEMEYEEDMIDEDDEDNISDEDEDLEGMGPIEGLSGEHGLDVEVDMGDDDEGESGMDDDEEDSGDDDEDEDDDEDDDMDDDEMHDHGHVEIVDEDGNVLHGHEDDAEWQSEDEEDEEDYEGRAADEEEAELHAMELDHRHIHGDPLSNLVRALGAAGGDDSRNAVEILQRIDAGELDHPLHDADHDHGMEFDFNPEGGNIDEMDGEEDDEDEDDMDEDEGMALYDEYPQMPFDFDEDIGQPIIINHRGHPHRTRMPGIPYPFIAGGPRDLGGMSDLANDLQVLRDLQQSNQILLDLARDHHLRQADILAGRLGDGRAEPTRWETALPVINEIIVNRTNYSSDIYGRGPAYRSHRPGSNPRGVDEGTNPLLHRNSSHGLGRDVPGRNNLGLTAGISVIGSPDGLLNIGIGRGGPFGENPEEMERIMNILIGRSGSIARNGQALTFQVAGGPSAASRQFEALFGMGAPRMGYDSRRREGPFYEPGSAGSFYPQSTTGRWVEEARLLFGASQAEKANNILMALMAALVPACLRASIDAKKIEEELKKKRDEEERIVREKQEAEEKVAREKKAAEEAEQRVRLEEEAEHARANAPEQAEADDADAEAMEGVESVDADHESVAADEGPTVADQPRVFVTIQGREVDVTELGIDPTFLAELPEELREEVVASAVQDRRAQVAATGEQPSGIEQEFLDALPPEIREEIIQQERLDRRRREREEARRQAATSGGGGGPPVIPADMDAASILATLDPALRDQVLMEQNDEMLALLPREWAERANAGRRPERVVIQRGSVGVNRPIREREDPAANKPVRRAIVQMLDKSGVATLLRLMFVLQQGSLRTTLFEVLQNVSENRHNRGEVISTLLHILQDGSADMTAVERSFAHLSLRAKQPKENSKDPKTPQPMKRTLTGSTGINIVTSAEVSPQLVVQQCLSTLVYLCQVNGHIPSFFLTEHDGIGGLRRNTSRKGKGKETKASKYAINSLLGLLDRKLIIESASIMESLSDLLSKITSPLQALERKQKEDVKREKAARAIADAEAEGAAPNVVSQGAATVEDEASTEGPMNDSNVENSQATAEPATSAAVDASTTVAEPSEKSGSKAVDTKKSKPITAPVIPEANLKLVINIFVARECGHKTFRDTLSTVKNLACVPGAKEVFGRELVIKAQELAESILSDLDHLLPQIQKAASGTEIQGVALAKFSPSGSEQNKLLRVLKALDHIFESKPVDGSDEEVASANEITTEKQDLLASLYENPRFNPMWEKLSTCLSAIRQRENMLNVATILLPLIESLLVVCKNTTLKDVSNAKSQSGLSMVVASPPPESRMENLFFSFTEEHRKILNDLVRNSPKLMTGSFSLLVKNPKVLEFDNKRNYFSRSMHDRDRPTRQSYPPLQFSVKRESVFLDSYRSLHFKKPEELKYGKLSIRFQGEEGVDAGGVTREWFQVLTRQMFDPGYALFIPVSSDRTTFHPNHLSSVNAEHLSFFKFIGRVIGKALYEGRVLDCHFSRAVYKSILGKPVSVKDMESLDPEYYKSVNWMLENDITDVIAESFSVDDDQFGVINTIDLIHDGRNIPVTEDNKAEYVRLMVEHKLTGSVKVQLDEFLRGFHEIIPAELISIFNEQELELLISGMPEIDVDDWKNNTELHQYTASSPQIQWFWRAIRSYDKEERAKLLQFVTGTSKVPLNGFKELEGMNGFSRFNIHRDYGNKDRLPTSHTCFNQLDLPEYESYETLRQQILTAITAGSEYFGFA